MTIFNKPCQRRSIDYCADDTTGDT